MLNERSIRDVIAIPRLGAAAALVVSIAAIGCGGQSGAEGEWPAAPCAGEAALLIGRIEDVGGGCVSVRIERVIATGAPLSDVHGDMLFDGNPEVGSVVRGHLGSIYAFTHDFSAAEPVAVLVGADRDDLAFQLFPLEGERAQIHWAGKWLKAGFDDMTASDCPDRLEALR